jgi:anthranilate phosphoribosyltransferase
MRDLLEKLRERNELLPAEVETLFNEMIEGRLHPAVSGAALAMLSSKGVSPVELAAAARVMRRHAVTFDPGGTDDVLDTCGTGGDGRGTFNISTAAAIIAAGAGARVVKHGNRSASGRSGSADVLEKLGVRIECEAAKLPHVLNHAGVCFCFARAHHPAMKNVSEVRTALGIPTLFNLLGPLTNPGGAKRQLLGVYRPELLYLLAGALQALGSVHAWVVHGTDGLDELSTMASTSVAEVKDGKITRHIVDARELGLMQANLLELKAPTPEDSAHMISAILAGQRGAPRDIASLNAAAALLIANKVPDLQSGLKKAQEAIDSGAAKAALKRLVEATNS